MSTVDTPAAVATSTGFRVFSRASFSTSGGKVAEKSSVCRSSGVNERIFLTSSMKPISSISSASSSTTNSVQGKRQEALAVEIEHAPRAFRRRPARRPCSALICGCIGSPPTTSATRIAARRAELLEHARDLLGQLARRAQHEAEHRRATRIDLRASSARRRPASCPCRSRPWRSRRGRRAAAGSPGTGSASACSMPMAWISACTSGARFHSRKEAIAGGWSLGCRGSIAFCGPLARSPPRRRGRPAPPPPRGPPRGPPRDRLPLSGVM